MFEYLPMQIEYLAAGLCLVLPIVWFIIWLLVAIWAYKDAKRRGADSPIVWFLVVFFLGLIGLIIYIVARPKPKPQQPYMPPPPPPT